MTKFTKFAVAAAFAFGFVSIASAATVTVPPNLMQGSMGQEVMDMQSILGITADGNFGPMTKSAVMSFQAANGLTADGVVGPMTAAKLNAVTPVTPTPDTEDEEDAEDEDNDNGGEDFEGTEGSVDLFDTGSAEESDISEGQEEVELIAFDVELDDEGDLQLDRFDLYMSELNGGTHSSKPWDYFTSVYLMVDGDVVDEMDVDDSDAWDEHEDNDLTGTAQEYKLRFTGIDEILAQDETTSVTVAFDAEDNIDGDDEGATWYFGTLSDSFRFTDGTGFVFTDGAALEDSFTVDAAEIATYEISDGSDDPDASVIEVNDDSDTNGAEIAIFNIEETADVDGTIEEIVVTIDTTTVDVQDVVKKVYLFDGSDEIGSESVSGTGTSLDITFNDLGLEIDGDSDMDITVKVDLDDTNDQVRYANGETVEVSDVEITEADDVFGNDEGDMESDYTLSAETFAGNQHELFAEGINVEFTEVDSTSVSVDGSDNDRVELVIEFEVTAFGEDLYIPNVVTETSTGTTSVGTAPTTAEGVGFHVQYTATSTDPAGETGATSLTSTADEETNSFIVEEGETETFTLKVVVQNDGTLDLSGSSYRAILTGVNFADSDSLTGDDVFVSNLEDFKTDYEIVAD